VEIRRNELGQAATLTLAGALCLLAVAAYAESGAPITYGIGGNGESGYFVLEGGAKYPLKWTADDARIAKQITPPPIPPAKYDYVFKNRLIVFVEDDPEEFKKRCSIPGEIACAMRFPRLSSNPDHPIYDCIVFRMSDELLIERGSTVNITMRHALAHCNGWPGDHQGARQVAECTQCKPAPIPRARPPALSDAQTPAETNELPPQELAQNLHIECGEQRGSPGAVALCVMEKEKAFGKELDQVYKKALTLAGTNKPLLRENQRNWLKYQESNCKLRGQLAVEGELYKRPNEARCLLEMTLERLEELRGIVGCLSGEC